MHYGFIGTGGITTAMVTGLCTADHPPENIWVSPRNRQRADRLAADYASVSVGGSNQAVLDRSDVVVLAILPQHKEAVLEPLSFRRDQTVIHLLAGTPIDAVRPLVAPATEIVRAVPLPCTAIHKGPIAIYPHHHGAAAFFGSLGTVIALDQEAQLETLSIITALMAPYYAFVEQVVAWAVNEGIQRDKGASYTAAMFEALSTIAGNAGDGDIGRLINGCMTPGGLNERAMATIDAHGGFGSLTAALDSVKQKIG
ncbi:MAG: pyrroline-5-carboxylate reductase [Desulfosarcinaceae bacterium]|jgi:pyrroline-5-carboxylate reductase